MLSGIVGCAFLAAAPASAGNDQVAKDPWNAANTPPAVDALNEKFDAFGGSIGNQTIYGINGSVTTPLSSRLGAQIDGTFGSLGDNGIAEVAGHLFWRDPTRALFGLYASESYWDRVGGVNVGHVAAEGAAY